MSDPQAAEVTEMEPHKTVATKPAPNRRKVILAVSQVSRVGKSTVCATLLLDKLGGKIYSVENRSQDATQYGVEVEKFAPHEVQKLRAAMMLNPGTCIIDVGATQYDVFIKQIVAAQLIKIFDYIVVVTEPTTRAKEETVSTLETLRKIGFDLSKVRVVFNKSDPEKKVDVQFEEIFAYAMDVPELTLNKDCALPEMQVYDAMKHLGLAWPEVLADQTDYEALAMELTVEGKLKEAQETAERGSVQELAHAAQHWLGIAFPVSPATF
jgi:hypothetical protein